MAPSTLVVDTNFLLRNLDIVNGLVESHARFSHVVMVPAKVFEELDRLKTGNTLLGRTARTAIKYVQAKLAISSPGIRGQRLSEFVQSNLKGDDAILDCCRFFLSRSFTVLCSNDRNLCAKALVNDIKTVSYVKGMTDLLIAVRVSVSAGHMDSQTGQQILDEAAKAKSPTRSPESPSDATPGFDHDMADIEEHEEVPVTLPEPLDLPSEEYTSIGRLENDAKKVLLENTVMLIDFRMGQSFDSPMLALMDYQIPKATFKDIFMTLIRYRNEVFAEYLPPRVFNALRAAAKKPISNLTKSKFDDYIDLWGTIALHLSGDDPKYRQAMNSVKAVVDRFFA